MPIFTRLYVSIVFCAFDVRLIVIFHQGSRYLAYHPSRAPLGFTNGEFVTNHIGDDARKRVATVNHLLRSLSQLNRDSRARSFEGKRISRESNYKSQGVDKALCDAFPCSEGEKRQRRRHLAQRRNSALKPNHGMRNYHMLERWINLALLSPVLFPNRMQRRETSRAI